MSSSDVAIKVSGLSKRFEIYDSPRSRLKQFLFPRAQRLFKQPPRHYFREFWALRDLSLEIKKGETIGIIGRNGSGKSTLLQIICGTLTPSTGSVDTYGRVAALLELGSGFNPEFTGRENVYLNAAVLGIEAAEISARFDDIASFADIGEFMEQPVKTYSSGMAVRLAFAVAINVDPEILIVDEALSVGDELFQRKCFARIEAIRDKGATILFVSHSGATIVELCDRAVLLNAGECIAIGAPKDIVGRYQKLLYAPPYRQDAVLQEIRQSHAVSGAAKEISNNTSASSTDGDSAPAFEVFESFDPHLKPSSTIEFESRGAKIIDASLTTLSGLAVNNLVRSRSYRFGYTVQFSSGASNVLFGMLIKTVSGFELGGSSSASPGMGMPYIAAGAVVHVSFVFRCALQPGAYFLNAGCSGLVDGADHYLHRLVDAAMFRVLPEPADAKTGIVDFGCQSEIEVLAGDIPA